MTEVADGDRIIANGGSMERQDVRENKIDGNETADARVPMDEALFLRIKAAFEKRGGIIESGDNIDRHLDSMGAEAATFDESTIIIKRGIPTASTLFEELIHTAQYRKGIVSTENKDVLELEAKRKLVRNQKAYKIPDHENEETLRQIAILENRLINGQERD